MDEAEQIKCCTGACLEGLCCPLKLREVDRRSFTVVKRKGKNMKWRLFGWMLDDKRFMNERRSGFDRRQRVDFGPFSPPLRNSYHLPKIFRDFPSCTILNK